VELKRKEMEIMEIYEYKVRRISKHPDRRVIFDWVGKASLLKKLLKMREQNK